jgi:hypothetical protein
MSVTGEPIGPKEWLMSCSLPVNSLPCQQVTYAYNY